MHAFSNRKLQRLSTRDAIDEESKGKASIVAYTSKARLPSIHRTRPDTAMSVNHITFDRKTIRQAIEANKQRKQTILQKGAVKSVPKRNEQLDDFTIGGIIGKGSYAVVKSALQNSTQQRVAIKVYEKFKLHDPMKKKNVQREIAILGKLDHPNIIKLLKTVDTPNHLNLIMEHGGNISLKEFVRQKGGKLSESEAKELIKQLISAVEYLHSKNIVHRDLKLENVLLDDQLRVKLIDFGFAIMPEQGQKIKVFCGTPSYMAPEIIQKSISYGPPVDVWACGVILYYLLGGILPFKAQNERDLYKRIETGNYKANQIDSQGAANLIHKMLNTNQYSRVTADNALKDTWITPINISNQIQELKKYQCVLLQ